MPKRATPLTAVKVKAAKPGTHVDGGGLMLVVRPTGAATWVLRYAIEGRRRDMGLGPARGPYPVTLAAARIHVAELRKLIASGVDPLDKREADAAADRDATAAAALRKSSTFQEVADRYIAAHEAAWRNAKHQYQWRATLQMYAGPHIGAMPVADVTTAHVEATLRPIWTVKAEPRRVCAGG